MKNVEKSSSAGTENDSSTNVQDSKVCQPIAKPIVSSRLSFYKQPFHKSKYSGWVWDNGGNFVFQFESEFDEKGNFAKGCLEMQDKILTSLNSNSHNPVKELNLIAKGIEIYNRDKHLITIRGWGNLTGIGAHNFPPEKAANIQDNFRDWLIAKLSVNGC